MWTVTCTHGNHAWEDDKTVPSTRTGPHGGVTVKKAEPLFPDESVTCSEYVPGIVVGWRLNVAEKLPEPSTENCVPVHGTPLKSTSAHFIISYGAKLRPLIVNVEPGIPEVGDRVIAGGGGVTVKTALPLLPEESVTLTGYAPVG
jgi:hypothetical protein